MARKPARRRVLSLVFGITIFALGDLCYASCVAEAQALAEAEVDLQDAQGVYDIALAVYNVEPNCANSEALAEAAIDLEDAEGVRDEAQDEYDACMDGGEELQPIPLVIAQALINTQTTGDAICHSVLVVR